ncbi:hypothetical protein [Streptomyces sp. NPDC014734]|uniref:hypothetical protein n=1 Tax=Streptomyces sp. NPDC014734 TaxID=3364886 RepID=UPI0036F574B9
MQIPDDLDTSTPTVLWVFRNLMKQTSRPRTEVVDALMHCLPTAVLVGYFNDEPDIDLPLPGPDFADLFGKDGATLLRTTAQDPPVAPVGPCRRWA